MCPRDSAEKPTGRVACAGAVVRNERGDLLLVLRANDPGRGLWSLPGGRLEPGEDARTCAAREVLEETGLVVEVGDELLTVEIGAYDVTDFVATVISGELRAGDDAADVRWCAVDEFTSLSLTPSLLDALPTLGLTGRSPLGR
jgi:ADP-ribose pyrophosphatase YjhB (NUDIX family)